MGYKGVDCSMNHIFAPYIGNFMGIYLNDIVVYSYVPEEHVCHIKLVINTLHKPNFN